MGQRAGRVPEPRAAVIFAPMSRRHHSTIPLTLVDAETEKVIGSLIEYCETIPGTQLRAQALSGC
jgi:hypothetical protein